VIIISFFNENFTQKDTAPLRAQLESFYTDLQNNRTSVSPTNMAELSRPLIKWNEYITKLDAVKDVLQSQTELPAWVHNKEITPDNITAEPLTLPKEPDQEQITAITQHLESLK